MSEYRIHVITAMTVTIAFTVAACAPDSQRISQPSQPAPAAQTTDAGNLLVNQGDGLYHFAVGTVNAAAVPATNDGGSAVSGSAGGPARAFHDLDVVVHRLDGTTETVTIPNESLVVAAADAGEQSAVDAAGAGAVVVIDVSGLAGPAGARYILAGDSLTELADDPATPSADDVVTAPTPAPASTTTPAQPQPDTRVVIAVSDTRIADAIAAIDGVVAVTVDGPGHLLVATELDPATIGAAVGAVVGVTDVSEITRAYPTGDSLPNQQWSLANTGKGSQAGNWAGVAGADIEAQAAWLVTKGDGKVVAVIDSGVQRSHPDLVTQMWTNSGEKLCSDGVDDDGNGFVDDCYGWDFGTGNTTVANSGDNDPNPDRPDPTVDANKGWPGLPASFANHGTHVAGIVAAAQNGAGTVGVAPHAKIMALKIYGPHGNAGYIAQVVFAINYAVDNGADVINMSIATPTRAPVLARGSAEIVALEAAINRATAAGVVVVAAAGNNGTDIANTAVWPASLSSFIPGMITVGASTNSDTRASFSNFGTPVNLLAPGFWNLSSVAFDDPDDYGWDGFMSGTSMAAPAVAGAAALVMSSGKATAPADVRARLVASAEVPAAGPRLNAAVAVGVPPTLSVAYTGVGSLTPDTAGSIGINVQAASDTGISQIRLSVATRESGGVAAVEGLSATFSQAGTASTGVSSNIGAFPAIALLNASALHGSGLTITAADVSLPAGDYAFVTELLNESGAAVGGAQVAFVTISDQPVGDPGSGSTTATTVATNPITPMPTTPTTTPAGGGTTPPATTAPKSGGGTSTTAPATTSPAATIPGSTTATTAPASSGGTAPATTASGAIVPVTTTPAGTVPVSTAPKTTAPSSTATATTGPATTGPATTGPATTGPSGTTTTTPATTTPAPPPSVRGAYSVTAMGPRSAQMCGGTSHIIEGTFPTNVRIFVWFGSAVTEADVAATPSRLTVKAPAGSAAGTVDVTVRFTKENTLYELPLVNAFTYAGTCITPPGAGTSTTTPAGTVPVTTAPAGVGSGTTTPLATVPATAPANTSPAGTAPATTTPANTSPANTSPASTAPANTTLGTSAPVLTVPAVGNVIGNRGVLTLRSLPANGAIASLSITGWPATGCRQTGCGAARI